MRLLHDSSKAFEQQHWLPPEAPYWYPEPPEIDDSNPFPWMFVKGMGWVCCNNNFGLNWFDLEEPKPDPNTQVELVNAVLYWQKHVESEKDVLLAKMQEEDQQRGPPKGAVDVMCHVRLWRSRGKSGRDRGRKHDGRGGHKQDGLQRRVICFLLALY